MPTYPSFRHLSIDVQDGIAVVTLPLTPVVDIELHESLFSEMHDMFLPFTRDQGVEAVVITGQGDRLLHRQAPETNRLMTQASLHERAIRMQGAQQLVHQIVTFPKPFVAAANGPGAEHFLYADAIVATPEATFGDDHHVADGIAAGDGNTIMWPFLVGMPKARQTLYFNRRFGAEEALEMGWVNEVVPPAEIRDAGVRWARRMADLPRLPFLSTKLALNNWYRLAAITTMDLATAYQAAGLGDPAWVAAHT